MVMRQRGLGLCYLGRWCLGRLNLGQGRTISAAFIVGTVLLIAGCAELSAKSAKSEQAQMPSTDLPFQPALLSKTSAKQVSKQLAEIKAAMSAQFSGQSITLASNAFTTSSTVTIERKAMQDNRGLPIQGRHTNPAFVFTLLKQGDSCFLRFENNVSKVSASDEASDTSANLTSLAGVTCVASAE